MNEIISTYETEDTSITKTPTPYDVFSSEAFLNSYYATLADLKPRTIDSYKKGLRYFLQWLEDEGITEPNRNTVLAYKKHLQGTYKSGTVSTYLAAIRSFFNHVHAVTGGKYFNITYNVKNPRVTRGYKKDYLTEDQRDKVLDNMPRETVAQKRDYAICLLTCLTGVRAIEVSRATVKDLTFTGGNATLFIWGKGHDESDRAVYPDSETLEAITDYLQARKAKDGKLLDNDPLFASVSNRDYGQAMTTRSISRIGKEALKAAGFDSDLLTFHAFRHTAATNAIKNGASIKAVQAMLGHSSVSTTEIYAHMIDRYENRAEQFNTRKKAS